MDWLATEEGFKLAVAVEKARLRYLRAKETTKAVKARIKAGTIDKDAIKSQLENRFWLEDQLGRAFELEWLKALCDQMYHSLPRELRDMIYAPIVKYFNFDLRTPDYNHKDVKLRWYNRNMDFLRLEHLYFDPLTHFGEGVCRDVAHLSYRQMSFTFDSYGEYHLLRNILLPDRWGLGVSPADHLRVINLRIYEGHFGQPSLHRNLAAFCQLKHKASICIIIVPMARQTVEDHDCTPVSGYYQSWGLETLYGTKSDITAFFNTLRPVFDILSHIKKVGHQLHVILEHYHYNLQDALCAHYDYTPFDRTNPEQLVGFGLEAWTKEVLDKKKNLQQRGLLCPCAKDEDKRIWGKPIYPMLEPEDDDAEDEERAYFENPRYADA